MFRLWKRKPRTLVLGRELAAARAAERARVASEPDLQSSMPKDTYPVEEGVRALLSPKLHPLDSELKDLCRRAALLDADAHARMRHAISMDEFYTLLAFSRRMAFFSIRASSPEGLREGVEAVALIEPARIDARDIPGSLGVLAYACTRVGQNPRSLFEDASKRADPQVAAVLRKYAQQSFSGKKLSDLSWSEEVTTKYGQAFVNHGFQSYAPTVDLVSIAVDIAEMLEADSYPAVGIQVATSLPPTWLRGAGEDAVRAALAGSVAGASVSGFPRSGSVQKGGPYALLVFLVECADEVRAATLLGFARSANHGSHTVFGCAEDRLFCLIVAPTGEHGAASIETASSLARFETGIRSAMRRALDS